MWRSRNLGSERSSSPDLFLAELDLALADLEPPEHQLVGHSLGPVGRMLERMGQDRLLDRGRDAVGVRSLRSRQLVEQPLVAVHLEVAADLVEVLPALAQNPARLHQKLSSRNVAKRLKLPLVSRQLGTSRTIPHVLGAVGEERVGYLVGDRISNSRRWTRRIELDPESPTATHRNRAGVADACSCYDLDSKDVGQEKRIERRSPPPLVERIEYESPRLVGDGVHGVQIARQKRYRSVGPSPVMHREFGLSSP